MWPLNLENGVSSLALKYAVLNFTIVLASSVDWMVASCLWNAIWSGDAVSFVYLSCLILMTVASANTFSHHVLDHIKGRRHSSINNYKKNIRELAGCSNVPSFKKIIALSQKMVGKWQCGAPLLCHNLIWQNKHKYRWQLSSVICCITIKNLWLQRMCQIIFFLNTAKVIWYSTHWTSHFCPLLLVTTRFLIECSPFPVCRCVVFLL